jgi:predicted membrane-bound dolichyl-phosphate-mannose-protein mannosyltransferase
MAIAEFKTGFNSGGDGLETAPGLMIPSRTGQATPKQWGQRLLRWQYFGLCLLVLVTLALHFSIIMQPGELVFDEQHYVTDARSILQDHETLRSEHPPLAKLFIVSGIALFGDNAFGWRFFSVIFGTICIVLFYFICRSLAMSERASLLATFLLTLENMSFVQASVAMLDVYSLAFMLGSFLLYLRGRYLFPGISVGLAALAKLSGALAFPAILLHWFFSGRANPQRFLILILSTPLSFLLLMPLFDFIISRRLLNPIDRIQTMLSLTGSLTFSSTTHEAATYAIEWVLRPLITPYWYDPHYLAAISFNIWALIIPAVGYMAFRATRGSRAGLFGLAWFASTYLVWIPANYITGRISFVYYFYPTIGAICIGLGMGLSQLLHFWKTGKSVKRRRAALLGVSAYLLLHVGMFIALSPVFT